jgi:Transglutaminase-like superfamily
MARVARSAARNPNFARAVHQKFGASPDRSLRAVYRYRSENEEIIRTPEYMLHDLETRGYIEGDCDDISTLAAAVYLALGARAVRFVAIIYTSGEVNFEHVYAEVFSGGGWASVDLTVPSGTTHNERERMVEYV